MVGEAHADDGAKLTQAIAAQMFSTALAYSYDHVSTAAPQSAESLTAAFLGGLYLRDVTQGSDRLLKRRNIDPSLYGDLSRGAAVVLKGYRGTGKTAIIHSLQRSIAAQGEATHIETEPSMSCHVISCKSIRDELEMEGSPEQQTAHSNTVVTERIESQLRAFLGVEPGASEELLNAIRWRILRHSTHLAELRNRVGQRRLEEMHGWEDLRHAAPLEAERITVEADEVMHKPGRVLRHLLTYCSSVQHTPIIVIDNLDDLPSTAVIGAIKAGWNVSNLTTGAAPVLIAIRPETNIRVSSMTQHPVVVYRATDVDLESTSGQFEADLEDIDQIFRARLEVLKNPQLIAQITHIIASESAVSIDTSELQDISKRNSLRFAAVVRQFKRDYLDALGDTERRFGRRISELFVRWHNGNIREIASSLAGLSQRHLSHDGSTWEAGLFDAKRIRDQRTRFIRHLLSYGRPGPTQMRSAFPIYERSADRDPSRFGFLELRVLQYLNRTPSLSTVPLSKLYSDFATFEVDPVYLQAAVQRLSFREGYETGFLRADYVRELPEIFELPPDAEVSLLPAGRELLNYVGRTIEFLFWYAVSDQSCHRAIRWPSELNPDPTDPERLLAATDDVRVSVAVSFLHDVLLQRLAIEHPYLLSERWSKKDVDWIVQYQRMFGFQRNSWLLDRFLEQVRFFMRYSRIEPTEEVSNMILAIQNASRILDRMLVEGTQR